MSDNSTIEWTDATMITIRPFTPRETAYHYASGLVDDIAGVIITTQAKARIDAFYDALQLVRGLRPQNIGALPVDPCEAAQSVLNQAAAAIQAVLDGIERADDEAP